MNDKKENPKKTTYEKPISLSGATFKEVIKALLDTKKPNKNTKNGE